MIHYIPSKLISMSSPRSMDGQFIKETTTNICAAPTTPKTRKVIPGLQAPLFETNLWEKRRSKIIKHSVLWGSINMGLLAVVLYDLMYTCPIYVSYVQYIEYICAVVFALNVVYHFGRYLKVNMASSPFMQKKDDVFNKQDVSPNLTLISPKVTPNSWMTAPNYSPSSWTDNQASGGSPLLQSSRRDTSGIDFINDEHSLQEYLKDFEANERAANLQSMKSSVNALSSFWSHPMARTAKDVSAFLKRCQYQLSSPTGSSQSASPKSDDNTSSPIGSNSQAQGMDTWRRLNIDSTKLTQWNANLRMWISQTILNRLIKEFENIDDALQKQGLLDMQIGKVGLERLRKTAQTGLVLQFVPTLPTMLPFLELTANQDYLVNRIRGLAKGGCMSDFKWNSGGNYNGKDWDQSLPTDSTIIMHLFASYLDTQLMPLPNQPDTKPFTGYHFVKIGEKLPQLTSRTLAIQQISEYPPHYRVVIGEDIFELVKGYNNLFYSILLFLYYVNQKEHGMLGRVNLGRSGVNMLWIIQL